MHFTLPLPLVYPLLQRMSTLQIQHPKPLRIGAQVVSYIFHPLFLPAAIAYVLLFLHPINTLLLEPFTRKKLLMMVLLNTVLFPAVVTFLLWRLKFIKNIYLENQRERIIPFTASIIFYFWAFYVSRNLNATPQALQQWLLGVFLCSCVAMFCNIFFKISMHAIGVGGLVTYCAWQQFTDPYWMPVLLLWSLLIAGLVCTARLIRNAHSPTEIYAGLAAGAVCQVAAGLIAGV